MDVEQDVRTAVNQTLVIRAENTNNDGATSWSIDVPSGVNVDNTRVSDDERTFWARLTITPDAPGSPFDVTFTATDGQGHTDTANTTLDARANEDEADIQAHDDAVVEDTSLNLTADVHLYSDTADRVEVVKNYVGGATQIADAVDADTYTAGPFDYEHPGTHQVGYRTVDAEGHEVTLVHDLEVTEQAPELSSISELDVAPGQTVSFDVDAWDPDGESVDWAIRFVNQDEITGARLLEDGDTAHFVGTITSGIDSGTTVTVEAEDSEGATNLTRVRFQDADPDITSSSPASTVEDTSVTLSATVDVDDRSPAQVRIYKNYLVDGGLYAVKDHASQVDGDTWEATYTYGQVGTHYPGYQIETADGNTATLVGEIAVTEQLPEVSAADSLRADETQTAAVVATAEDDSTVDWSVDDGGLDGNIAVDGNRVVWQAYLPVDPGYDKVDVEFTATDDAGATASATTTVLLRENPLVDPLTPKETRTGVAAFNPILGEDLRLAAHVDDPDVETGIVPDWPLGPVLDATEVDEVDDNVYGITGVSYSEPGAEEIGYLATDQSGNQAGVVQTIYPEENDAPRVSTHPDVTLQGSGEAPLRSSATDPEAREIPKENFAWFYVDGPRLDPGEDERFLAANPHVGAPHDTFSEVGVHTLEVRASDRYGGTGTSRMTVTVDDVVRADGELTTAEGRADGVYLVDPANHAGDRLAGNVSVTDGAGNPVANAKLEADVVYYGSRAKPVGTTVASFDNATDASGNATFQYDQALLGAAGGGPSLASLPGYHEVQLTVWADSDPFAPIPDTETASLTIPYHVGPALLGPT